MTDKRTIATVKKVGKVLGYVLLAYLFVLSVILLYVLTKPMP